MPVWAQHDEANVEPVIEHIWLKVLLFNNLTVLQFTTWMASLFTISIFCYSFMEAYNNINNQLAATITVYW